jgi:hypothetical protein
MVIMAFDRQHEVGTDSDEFYYCHLTSAYSAAVYLAGNASSLLLLYVT